jgi:hypothetical protein
MVDGRVRSAFGAVRSTILKLPGILSLIVEQPWVVITFVEVFQDTGEDFGLLFGQVDAFGIRLEELAAAGGFEERRLAKDVFVSGKETLFRTDTDGNDGRSKGAVVSKSKISPTLKALEGIARRTCRLEDWYAPSAETP